MPNHVRNKLRFYGNKQRLIELFAVIKNDCEDIEPSIDFNKIIPMPEELDIESSSRTDRCRNAYELFVQSGASNPDNFLQQHDMSLEDLELGKRAYNNIIKYGAADWYHWRIAHWDTKWNAYNFLSSTPAQHLIVFDTAWSPPRKVIAKLAEMYPDVRIKHEWADEDMGYNCGRIEYKNGIEDNIYIPKTGVKAMDFACTVHDIEPIDYGLMINAEGDRYVYVDEFKYEPILFFGRPALFIDERIPDALIPKGLYRYSVRSSDDGENNFATVERNVVVNFSGTVITSRPLYFGDSDYIALSEDDAPNFTGDSDTSLKEYIEMSNKIAGDEVCRLRDFLMHNGYYGTQCFNTRNTTNDSVKTVYKADGITVDYCTTHCYLEIFGLTDDEYNSLRDVLLVC